MTDQEIESMISKMFSSYQDKIEVYFELSHSDQAKILDQLLNEYPKASQRSRQNIEDATTRIIKSYWTCFDEFTDVLVRHLDKEPVDAAVMTMCNSGIFCVSLLESLKKYRIRNEKWKEEIKKMVSSKKFKETYETDIENLYIHVNELIAWV